MATVIRETPSTFGKEILVGALHHINKKKDRKLAREQISSRERLGKSQIEVSRQNAEAQTKLANIAVSKHEANKTVNSEILEQQRISAVAKARGDTATATAAEAQAKFLKDLDEQGRNAYFMSGKNNDAMRNLLLQSQIKQGLSDIQMAQADLTIKALQANKLKMESTESVFSQLSQSLSSLMPELVPMYQSRINMAKQDYTVNGPASPVYQQLITDMGNDIKTSQETMMNQSLQEGIQKGRIAALGDIFENEEALKGLSPAIKDAMKVNILNALGIEAQSERGLKQTILGSPSIVTPKKDSSKPDNRPAGDLLKK